MIGHCEECHENLERLISLLEDQQTANRDLLAAQRLSIPKFLQNARWFQSNVTQLVVTGLLQTQQVIKVTTVIADTTSPGQLLIQDRTWPINGLAVLNLGVDGMLIRPNDLIQLQQGSAGTLFLEFLGQELADQGARW